MIIFCCINLSAMCNLALKRFFFREKSDVSAVPYGIFPEAGYVGDIC